MGSHGKVQGRTIRTIRGERYFRFSDGVLDNRAWRKASCRVLHLLKETTHPEGRIGKRLAKKISTEGRVPTRHPTKSQAVHVWKVTALRSVIHGQHSPT